jgi:carbon monoxide dehydrogenase subunit G
VELTHTFRIPVPVDEAWTALRDIQRVGPCMPGATIDSVDGDAFTGGVKVKVGPITMSYKGEASFVDVDEEQHRASIEARGRETRGSGTARATVRAELRGQGGETEVTLVTDLAVTGRPAQFGRGVMADVGNKLVGQFADCLSAELAGRHEPAPDVAIATPAMGPDGTERVPVEELTGPAAPASATSASTAQDGAAGQPDEAIDLLDVAGAPLLKRIAPVIAGVAAVLLLVRLARRRRKRRADPVREARQIADVERKVAKLSRGTERAERRIARSAERTAKAAERTVRAERRRVEAQRRLAEIEAEAEAPIVVVEDVVTPAAEDVTTDA